MRDNLPAWLRRSLVTKNVCLEAAQMIEEQAEEIRKLTAERDEARAERDELRPPSWVSECLK